MSATSSGNVATTQETATNSISDDDLKRLLTLTPDKLNKQQLRRLFEAFYGDVQLSEGAPDKADGTKRPQAEQHAAAYVLMSSLVQSVRGKPPMTGDLDEESAAKDTKRLAMIFRELVLDDLHGAVPAEQAGALSLLSALFDVDSPSATRLVQDTTILNAIMELLDGSPKKPVDMQMARLIGRAMSYPHSRSIMREECDSRAVRWLISVVGETSGPRRKRNETEHGLPVKASATLALIKLYQGTEQDQQLSKYIPSSSAPPLPSMQYLVGLLQEAIVATPTATFMSSINTDGIGSYLLDAVEGLAYLSTSGPIRTQIASSAPLLSALFALAAETTRNVKPSTSLSFDRFSRTDSVSRLAQTNLAMHYGLAFLFSNLCKYKPILTQEEQQVNKLRKMAQPPSSDKPSSKIDTAQDGEEEEEYVSNAAVLSRTRLLSKAGLLPVLAGLARSPSGSARACVARAYLGIVQDVASRGEVLKTGGGKALLSIVSEGRKSQEQMVPDWIAIQALAKLAITAPPVAVFGPDPGATHDAIGPLTSVLTYSSDITSSQKSSKRGPLTLACPSDDSPTQLQRFESLMALTNVASVSPDMAKRILRTNGLVREVEGLLVEDHVLIRRAAVELVCNLVACEDGFNLFMPNTSTGGNRAQSRLHVLVALSDVEDVPTRKAASGALAMLTSEEAICLGLVKLQKERGSVLGILGRLLLEDVSVEDEEGGKGEEPVKDQSGRLAEKRVADPDLVYRGIVIFRNLAVLVLGPQKPGWRDFLSDLVREQIVESVEAVVEDCMKHGGERARGPVVQNALEFGLALKKTSDTQGH